MATEDEKTSLKGLFSAQKKGTGNSGTQELPFTVLWDHVLCSAETSGEDAVLRYHTLADELPQLIEYAKQGVRVDMADTPENYLKNSV